MLTEVATGPRAVHDRRGVSSAVRCVAASMAAAEQARRLRRDATAVVERMAVQARSIGVDHPVAAALARATRVGQLCGVEEFARRNEMTTAQVTAAESGVVAWGDLPWGYDTPAAAMGLDLLSLADLQHQWRVSAVTQGARR